MKVELNTNAHCWCFVPTKSKDKRDIQLLKKIRLKETARVVYAETSKKKVFSILPSCERGAISISPDGEGEKELFEYLLKCQERSEGKSGFVRVGEETRDGKECVLFSARVCIECGAGITIPVSIPHRDVIGSGVCDECAQKCNHNWKARVAWNEKHAPFIVEACLKCLTPKRPWNEVLKEADSLDPIERQRSCFLFLEIQPPKGILGTPAGNSYLEKVVASRNEKKQRLLN